MAIPVLRIIPFDTRQDSRHPRVLGFKVADPQGRVEFEHTRNQHRDQCLLHLDPMTGHVPIETVLAIQHVHMAVMGAGAFVETHRNVELAMHLEQRIPIIGMPEMSVDRIRPHERADGPQLVDAAHQFGARHIHVLHRQHRRPFQLVRAVLRELVDPVVVSLTKRQCEMWVHIVPRDEAQSHGREHDGDVDPLKLHAHDLSFRVVVPLDGEVEIPARRHAGARQRLRGLRLGFRQ